MVSRRRMDIIKRKKFQLEERKKKVSEEKESKEHKNDLFETYRGETRRVEKEGRKIRKLMRWHLSCQSLCHHKNARNRANAKARETCFQT